MIALAFIAILIVLLVGFVHKTNTEAKEMVLRSQLTALRNSVNMFKIVKEKYPSTLGDLVSVEYKTEINSAELFGQSFLDKRLLLDPFGNSFGYDPKTGAVSSQTCGYEDW